MKVKPRRNLAPDSPLTPDLYQTGNADCKKCIELLARIERFRKVLKDKDQHIADMNDFLDKVRRVLGEQTAVLTPRSTTRPAKKGKL